MILNDNFIKVQILKSSSLNQHLLCVLHTNLTYQMGTYTFRTMLLNCFGSNFSILHTDDSNVNS